jgi:hypothetical protein
MQHIIDLKKQVKLLEDEIKKLTPKKHTTSPTKNKEECHPDWMWNQGDDGTYYPIKKVRNHL